MAPDVTTVTGPVELVEIGVDPVTVKELKKLIQEVLPPPQITIVAQFPVGVTVIVVGHEIAHEVVVGVTVVVGVIVVVLVLRFEEEVEVEALVLVFDVTPVLLLVPEDAVTVVVGVTVTVLVLLLLKVDVGDTVVGEMVVVVPDTVVVEIPVTVVVVVLAGAGKTLMVTPPIVK
jgi:hypothetical protein